MENLGIHAPGLPGDKGLKRFPLGKQTTAWLSHPISKRVALWPGSPVEIGLSN